MSKAKVTAILFSLIILFIVLVPILVPIIMPDTFSQINYEDVDKITEFTDDMIGKVYKFGTPIEEKGINIIYTIEGYEGNDKLAKYDYTGRMCHISYNWDTSEDETICEDDPEPLYIGRTTAYDDGEYPIVIDENELKRVNEYWKVTAIETVEGVKTITLDAYYKKILDDDTIEVGLKVRPGTPIHTCSTARYLLPGNEPSVIEADLHPGEDCTHRYFDGDPFGFETGPSICFVGTHTDKLWQISTGGTDEIQKYWRIADIEYDDWYDDEGYRYCETIVFSPVDIPVDYSITVINNNTKGTFDNFKNIDFEEVQEEQKIKFKIHENTGYLVSQLTITDEENNIINYAKNDDVYSFAMPASNVTIEVKYRQNYSDNTEAYAEFDSSTGQLRIFRDDFNLYTNEQVIGTKTYYTGIETITGMTQPRWSSKAENITSVIIEDGFKPKTAYKMFSNCSNLTTISGISNLDTSAVIYMREMFKNCSSLTSLDTSNFDTSNVTDMNSMFNNCSTLTSLDVSGFNTENVTDMNNLFRSCSNLTSLDVSNFNTDEVRGTSAMFLDCSSLTSLDVSNFNMENVGNMNFMFNNCSNLTSLDVSNFNTSSATDMSYMFENCSNLISLDVSNFNTNNVTNMCGMFNGCSSLTSLDVSNFNTSNVTNIGMMFFKCSNLTSLDTSNFNTNNVTKMYWMFADCKKLTNLDLSNFNTSNVENMTGMFSGSNNLTNIDLSNFNTSNVTEMEFMFDNCSSITTLDLSSFDTSNVTAMDFMFEETTKLNTLKLGTDWHFLPDNYLTKSWLRDGDTTLYTATQLTNSYNGSTMAGTYRAVQKLTITEQVKGSIANTNKNFNFTINVSDEGEGINTTQTYTGSKTGSLEFNNGTALFTLKHGENISIYLPYNNDYVIIQDSDGYTLAKTNDTGTLNSNKTATFINTLNGTTPTGIILSFIPYIILLIIGTISIIWIYRFKTI